jgi:hypothetical protein
VESRAYSDQAGMNTLTLFWAFAVIVKRLAVAAKQMSLSRTAISSERLPK